MKNPIAKILPFLLCLVLLNACQKENSSETKTEDTTSNLRLTGTLPDDPQKVAKVPTVMSVDFLGTVNGRKGKTADTDGDGIRDAVDACPTSAETVNGYQDEDGCPDTVPVATPVDTDGDSIADTSDACPTQPETFNGYEDTDGCPDTVPDPVVLPATPIPASFFLSTPPVGSQGNEGSCVPFAVAYAARSIEQFYRTGATAYSFGTNVFSPEYVYNQTKFGDCSSGTSIVTVLDLIQNQGVSTWQVMPYSDVNGCSIMPDATQMDNASAYKISSYVKIPNSDQTAIKTMIASNHPVITTVIADNSFVNAKAGFIWKTDSGSGALPHTIIICGYDDVKNAYKIMNSWGTGWADGGFSWIDYDFFIQKSSYYTYAIQ